MSYSLHCTGMKFHSHVRKLNSGGQTDLLAPYLMSTSYTAPVNFDNYLLLFRNSTQKWITFLPMCSEKMSKGFSILF